MLNIGSYAADNAWAAVAVFFAMVIGHAFGDFGLQNGFVSSAKNRHSDLSRFFPEGPPLGVSGITLLAHALIHAGLVWLITGYVVLAVAEFVLHTVIDWAKGEGWFDFAIDQALHIACKVIFAVLLFLNWPDCLDWMALM